MTHPVFENVIILTFMAQKSMIKARGSGYGKEETYNNLIGFTCTAVTIFIYKKRYLVCIAE